MILKCWFLHRPKADLYKRIDERCDKMLEQGLIEEVKHLKEKGLCENTSASQAIGYRHCLDYLMTSQSPADYAKFVEAFKKASRNYAKRQFTWFRREPLFRWLDMEMHDPEVALEMVISDWQGTE